MRLVVVFSLLTLLPLLTAQEPQPRPSRGHFVDGVVATVNDSPILATELNLAVSGQIRTQEELRGRLSAADIEIIRRRVLNDLIDARRMGQAAKSFGALPPEQIESIVRSELDRDKQAMIRDLGTYTEVSREFQRQGRTWATHEREQRATKLSEIAEDLAIHARLARQTNLFLTPLMLRQTYATYRDRFVRAANAQVSLVAFRGPNAADQAAQAAAMWRQEALTSRELAKRFPGATPLDDLVAASLVPELQAFALAGPEHAVSAPLAIQDAVQVARITRYLPARAGRFEDQDVQEELRDLARQQVILEFRQQALERARERTEVWIAPAYR